MKISFSLVFFLLAAGFAGAQNMNKISSDYNEAVRLIGEHQYKEAELKLDEVIMAKPDYAEAISARGTSRLMQGKRSDACEDFAKAAALGWKAAERSVATYCGKDAPDDKINKQQD